MTELRSTAPPTEISTRFLQEMVDRMATSFYKYGPVADNYPENHRALDSLLMRLERYETTGNTEWLIDVANFAMIEFMHPAHRQAHYRATSAEESPGVQEVEWEEKS